MISGNEFEALCDSWEKKNPLYSIKWMYDVFTNVFKVIVSSIDGERSEENPPSTTAHIPIIEVSEEAILLTFDTMKDQLELYLKYGIEI